MKRFRHHPTVIFLLVIIISSTLVLTSACERGEKSVRIAAYGNYGSEIAKVIGQHFPYRSPGSTAEKEAADYLVSCWQALGYEPKIESFQFVDHDGMTKSSQNIVVRLEGSGFRVPSGESTRVDKSETIVIGAHYDVPVTGPDYIWPGLPAVGEGEEPVTLSRSYREYNGIHDNGSGVATVLMTGLRMRKDRPAYNVEFVLFGAGNSSYAGARAYMQMRTEEEIEKIACMYNIGPIYAGEKIYAHAGQSSAVSAEEKSYPLRRKLYEATDIFYNYELNTNNGYALYTNQASFFVMKPGTSTQVVFREWTTHTSDHTPFDERNIPVVYFESGDYNVDSMVDFGPENRDPDFRETGGMISGTPYDSEFYLFNVFRRLDEARRTELILVSPSPPAPITGAAVPEDEDEEDVKADQEPVDRLTQRINNTAFILIQAARRGPDGSEPVG